MSWETWNGDDVFKTFVKKQATALFKASNKVLIRAKQEVPLDKGDLLRSGMVIVNPNDALNINISFGGGTGTGLPKVPYALKWHENDANFQQSRKKRYLADPFNKHFEKDYRGSF